MDSTLLESFHSILLVLLKYFPCLPLSRCVSYYKCTPAAQARLRCHPNLWVFSTDNECRIGAGGLYTAKECRIVARGGAGLLSLEQGFMTFNAICIIVCISCSVSTQCQHGWAVLISKLHHKDKRNTCQYKVILLPTARVKLFRRTRHSGSCFMNRQIIASWFHKAKSLIQIEVGSLLLGYHLCICISPTFLLTYWFGFIIIPYIRDDLYETYLYKWTVFYKWLPSQTLIIVSPFRYVINGQQSWLLSVGVTLLAIFHRKLEHLNGNSPTSCEK